MAEKSGGPVSYYLVNVTKPNQGAVPYQAECGDIAEALNMTFSEGNAFKAIWRTAAARTLGKLKEGGDAKYDAEKVEFYGGRMIAAAMTDEEYMAEKFTGVVIDNPGTVENGKQMFFYFLNNVEEFRKWFFENYTNNTF